MLKRLRERITPTDVVMWLIGGAMLALIIWGSAATITAGRYSRYHWFDFVIFGLAQGSIYALIAMGYTMVYGVLRMINFAHSEVFMSGPYTAYYVAAAFYSIRFFGSSTHPLFDCHFPCRHGDFNVDRLSSGTGCLSSPEERTPFDSSHHGHWSLLLPSIHLSGALWLRVPGLSRGEDLEGQMAFGEFRILTFHAVVIVAAALLLVALYSFIQRTRVGKAIRAVSEDKEASFDGNQH